MDIELVSEQNYPVLVEWYKGWDLPITPFAYIPRNSIIVGNVCAGFVYQLDNTSMWWIEGVVSNPSVMDTELKKQALTILIKSLEDVVKVNNGDLIMTSTPRETLNCLFVERGFSNTPEKYFHLARFI